LLLTFSHPLLPLEPDRYEVHLSANVDPAAPCAARKVISRLDILCPVPPLAAKYARHDSLGVAFNEPTALVLTQFWRLSGRTFLSI